MGAIEAGAGEPVVKDEMFLVAGAGGCHDGWPNPALVTGSVGGGGVDAVAVGDVAVDELGRGCGGGPKSVFEPLGATRV